MKLMKTEKMIEKMIEKMMEKMKRKREGTAQYCSSPPGETQAKMDQLSTSNRRSTVPGVSLVPQNQRMQI